MKLSHLVPPFMLHPTVGTNGRTVLAAKPTIRLGCVEYAEQRIPKQQPIEVGCEYPGNDYTVPTVPILQIFTKRLGGWFHRSTRSYFSKTTVFDVFVHFSIVD